MSCPCWDAQPGPLRAVMDEREGEEENAASQGSAAANGLGD